MYTNTTPTFALDNFEGPLELLLCLIQKEEIDVCSIAVKKLTEQVMQMLSCEPEVDRGSESLNLTATLLLMKSQKLLPQEENVESVEEEDPRMQLIQSLIEYCRFKEAAKALSFREEEQKAHFIRAPSPFRKELGPGLEEIGIEHLKSLIAEITKRAALTPRAIIKEEEWQVSHQLEWLKFELSQKGKILFSSLFSSQRSRMELIVLFLALLEMLKASEARVVKENEKLYIIR